MFRVAGARFSLPFRTRTKIKLEDKEDRHMMGSGIGCGV